MNARNLRLSFRKTYKPLLFLSLVVYFSYHIFQGRHGLLAWGQLSKELQERQNYLMKLKDQQAYLQHKVDLMGNHLCLDLLEEETKKKLGMVHKNEIVVILQ